MIVAIDGHAGSGKSSIGRRLARELGLQYVDTGAMYRAVALGFLETGVDPDSAAAVREALDDLPLRFEAAGEQFRVFLGSTEVTARLRGRKVGQLSSKVAALEEVRRHLTELQRSFARLGDLVVDGRDIGTVVFPEAEVKIFLTASPEARAIRRHRDRAGGRGNTLQETFRELEERDQADSVRSLSPLMPAEDAEVIDTTELSLEKAYCRVLSAVLARKEKDSAGCQHDVRSGGDKEGA